MAPSAKLVQALSRRKLAAKAVPEEDNFCEKRCKLKAHKAKLGDPEEEHCKKEREEKEKKESPEEEKREEPEINKEKPEIEKRRMAEENKNEFRKSCKQCASDLHQAVHVPEQAPRPRSQPLGHSMVSRRESSGSGRASRVASLSEGRCREKLDKAEKEQQEAEAELEDDLVTHIHFSLPAPILPPPSTHMSSRTMPALSLYVIPSRS